MVKQLLVLAALAVLISPAASYTGAATRGAASLGRYRYPSVLRAAEDSNQPDQPPDVSDFQSDSQKRRNRPLSQLKRQRKVKQVQEPEGELRPLVKKERNSMSVLQGEDYWIDLSLVNEDNDKPVKPTPTEDQFKDEKLREEIVSPYKNNTILGIILGITAIIAFVQLNPGILDSYPIINFPEEL
ncbi:hypothetical protein JKP88DRAFT_203437 [Tribonema minus]|uniref:Uncharacterized protein n=1 Tax=Tribonema minus TaxID=303371 RepID=A0A835YJZ1_9STRA|nr:hypothetical protein JKP88DRAFT_203437 [Tribonema minus]